MRRFFCSEQFKLAAALLYALGHAFNSKTDALKCLQCMPTTPGCLDGTLQPTDCSSLNHTHCITYTYRENAQERHVLKRCCGTTKDLVQCGTYDASQLATVAQKARGKSWKTRNPTARLNNKQTETYYSSDTSAPKNSVTDNNYNYIDQIQTGSSQKQRKLPSLELEVCVIGCDRDGCINSATNNFYSKKQIQILFVMQVVLVLLVSTILLLL